MKKVPGGATGEGPRVVFGSRWEMARPSPHIFTAMGVGLFFFCLFETVSEESSHAF